MANNASTTDKLGRKEFAANQYAPPVPRLAYTMRQTAELLGVSYITIHRLLKRKLLRSSTALRTKLIPAAEIQRFLNSTLE